MAQRTIGRLRRWPSGGTLREKVPGATTVVAIAQPEREILLLISLLSILPVIVTPSSVAASVANVSALTSSSTTTTAAEMLL
jgi:hypothetical protein